MLPAGQQARRDAAACKSSAGTGAGLPLPAEEAARLTQPRRRHLARAHREWGGPARAV